MTDSARILLIEDEAFPAVQKRFETLNSPQFACLKIEPFPTRVVARGSGPGERFHVGEDCIGLLAQFLRDALDHPSFHQGVGPAGETSQVLQHGRVGFGFGSR